MPWLQGRYALQQADATDLPFEPRSFDCAFLCWVLEHVPSPARVLNEVRRVLSPGSPVYMTEVMNASFLLDPYSPNVWRYWMAFNDFQIDSGGDPFIGAKLGNLLLAGGYRDVSTQIKTFHFDNREPARRKTMIAFWEELLLSAADQLLADRQGHRRNGGRRAPRNAPGAERSQCGVLLFVRAGARNGLLSGFARTWRECCPGYDRMSVASDHRARACRHSYSAARCNAILPESSERQPWHR